MGYIPVYLHDAISIFSMPGVLPGNIADMAGASMSLLVQWAIVGLCLVWAVLYLLHRSGLTAFMVGSRRDLSAGCGMCSRCASPAEPTEHMRDNHAKVSGLNDRH